MGQFPLSVKVHTDGILYQTKLKSVQVKHLLKQPQKCQRESYIKIHVDIFSLVNKREKKVY